MYYRFIPCQLTIHIWLKTIFQNGVFIGSIITCLCILFAGFLVLFNHMPIVLYYVSHISYMRYALEGLVLSIYGYGREPLDCFNEEGYCHYRFPETTFKEIGMSDGKYCTDVTMMAGFLLFVMVISFFTLRKRVQSRWSQWRLSICDHNLKVLMYS